VLAIGALPLLAALCACAPRVGTGPGPVRELRVPLVREIEGLDPLEGGEIVTFNVVRQLYEGLVDYDPATLAPVPRLARSWRIGDEARSWTFELEPGARFVDDPCFPGGRGRPVTAEDARFSIERGLGPLRDGAPHPELPPIAGLDTFLARGSEHLAGLEVVGPRTLTIRLDRPDPALLHLLAAARCRVVAPEAVRTYGGALHAHAVGTGPFRLVLWEPLSGVLLVRNLGYWRRDSAGLPLPRLDALRFVPYWRGDPYRLFADGRIDMTFSYTRTAAGRDPAAPGASEAGAPDAARRYLVPRLNTLFVRFDFHSRNPLVRDPRLRRALSCALQRPEWSLRRPARGLFPPGLPGCPDNGTQRTDRAEAERLLAAAGHPRGRGLPRLRVVWREWDAGVGRALAASLRDIGLRVDLALCDETGYWPAVEGGQADLFRDGWMADYPDPQTFLEQFTSGVCARRGGYHDPDYDRLFLAFRAEPEPRARAALAARLERILMDDTPAIFMAHEREVQFVSGRVKDWAPNCTNPLNVCFYEFVTVGPAAGGRP
jgi:peptide/nickel transport system substrate-binding protein